MEKQELEIIDRKDVTVDLGDLRNTENVTYCSLPTTTREEKLKIFSMVQNPTKALKDIINVPFKLKNVYVEVITLESGEVAPRILLITDKGESYQCVSFGMFNNIKKLFSLLGEPPYTEPIEVVAKMVGTKKGQTYSLDIVK